MPFRKTCGQVSHAGTPENDHFGPVLCFASWISVPI